MCLYFSVLLLFSFFFFFFFFFNDTATTEIYTLSLHDALRSLEAARPPFDGSFGARGAARAGHCRLWAVHREGHALAVSTTGRPGARQQSPYSAQRFHDTGADGVRNAVRRVHAGAAGESTPGYGGRRAPGAARA